MNLHKIIRENTSFRVSGDTDKELENAIVSQLDVIMRDLEKFAKEDGRKTIKKEDVIRYFSYKGNSLYVE